jgi:hypothetical protein
MVGIVAQKAVCVFIHLCESDQYRTGRVEFPDQRSIGTRWTDIYSVWPARKCRYAGNIEGILRDIGNACKRLRSINALGERPLGRDPRQTA